MSTSGTFSSGVDVTGDLDVDGHTDLDNVSIAGVTTASGGSVLRVSGAKHVVPKIERRPMHGLRRGPDSDLVASIPNTHLISEAGKLRLLQNQFSSRQVVL